MLHTNCSGMIVLMEYFRCPGQTFCTDVLCMEQWNFLSCVNSIIFSNMFNFVNSNVFELDSCTLYDIGR